MSHATLDSVATGVKLRTILEIEAAGTHVSANNSGNPWLVRQFRKFGLLTVADGFEEEVVDQVRGSAPVMFWSREAFARAKKEWDKRKPQTARWKKSEITPHGEDWVRGSYVERKLGISKTMRQYWDKVGWPPELVKNLRTKSKLNTVGRQCNWYAKVQIDDEVLPALEALPSKFPSNHLSLFSEEKTAELLGVGIFGLCHMAAEPQHGLAKGYVLARIEMTHPNQKDPKVPFKRLVWLTGYMRKSVNDFLERKDASRLPPKTTTLRDLTRRLRKFPKCTVSKTSLDRLCREGVLDSKNAACLAKDDTIRLMWIISEEAGDEAIEIYRKNGWDNRAATVELQALHKHRIAMNNGQPPPSVVPDRIEEQHVRACKLAKDREVSQALDGFVFAKTAAELDGWNRLASDIKDCTPEQSKWLNDGYQAAKQRLGLPTSKPTAEPETGDGQGEAASQRNGHPNSQRQRPSKTPKLLCATDLIEFTGYPSEAVKSFLKRFRSARPDCFEENEMPRRNEPRIMYRCKDVIPALDEHFGPRNSA